MRPWRKTRLRIENRPRGLASNLWLFHDVWAMKPGWTTAAGLVAIVFVLMSACAAAQGAPANPYRPNTADEDWTFLKTAKPTDWWDPIKYIPLGPEDWSLTLSGELRLRPEAFRIRETAARAGTIDSYLARFMVGRVPSVLRLS